MTTYNEIPLTPTPQSFNIPLPTSQSINTNSYRMVFQYRDSQIGMGGWFMDIFDANDNPLVCGVPLVTGTDLLGQYAYLNFGAIMLVYSDGYPEAVPTFSNLGIGSHVLWITEP